jgi:thiol-disulfide isomerase/thioredoxin
MRMKKCLFLMMALLSFGGLKVKAQSFEFQYQGQSLKDGDMVTIAAEQSAFGELACETNPSTNPNNGLVLKLLSGSTANVKAELEITHNTLNAQMLQWCMGGDCWPVNDTKVFTKQFTVTENVQMQFDATNIQSKGYLLATVKATVGAETHQVAIQFTNGESANEQAQIWWGYFGEKEVSRLPYDGNLGYSQACTIDAAIFIPANHAIAGGGSISAIRVWLGDDISKINGDMTLWISKTLPDNVSSADYTQKVAKSSISARLNEIQLNTPYAVNNAGIYVGFTLSISSKSYPIMSGGSDAANAFLYRVTGRSWDDISEAGYGKLALQVLLDGVTLKDNCASPADFGTSYVLKGKSVDVPVKITNFGANVITSISYTIATNGIASAEQTVSTGRVDFNESKNVMISFPADAGARRYDKTLTITKVNGVANESALKVASGSLITIMEKPTVVPVVEEFTGTWCGWCPVGFDGMEKAHEQFGDKVALIAVHCGDQMEIEDYSPIANLASSYPSSLINRNIDSYPSAGNLKYYINDELQNRVAVASLQVSAAWTGTDKSAIKIDTDTKFVYTEDNGQYGIALALVEDGLKNPAWAQANYLSQRSGYESLSFWYNAGSVVSGLEFNHVPVAAWGIADGINGSVGSTIQAGDIQSFAYEASIAGKSLIQDKSKLKVIAMLIDRSTGRIANAAQTAINDYDASAIHAVSTTSEIREAGRCTLDGQRISTPQHGINIIRMNDGTVKKVIVK